MPIRFRTQITNSKIIRETLRLLIRDFTRRISTQLNWERVLKPFFLEIISESAGFQWLGTADARGQLGVAPETSSDLQQTVLDVINDDKITAKPTARLVEIRWGNPEILYGIETLHYLTRGTGDEAFSVDEVSWVKWLDEGVIATPKHHMVKDSGTKGRAGLGYIMKGGGMWKIEPKAFITKTMTDRARDIENAMAKMINEFWVSLGGTGIVTK